MQVDIRVGQYSDEPLERWIENTNSTIQMLCDRVLALETTIARFKEIVPLVDEDLGMHDAPTSIS